jgi:hypothetical protein
MNTPTPLDYFRQQYFGPVDHYLGWHDGYDADLTCLDRLSPAERQQAETELLAALQAPTDPRAILGLGHLHSRAALPALHRSLSQWGSYALSAIAQIDPKALDKNRLLQELRQPPESPLINLLVGIRSYFTLPQLDAPLIEQVFHLLNHAEYLVRYHALQTLRQLYVLPTAALATSTNLDAVRKDLVFQLISKDGNPADYRRAEQLVRLEVQAVNAPA